MRVLFYVLLILSMALASCSSKSTSGEELPPLDAGSAAEPASAPEPPTGLYEDFSDILVPIELTRLNEESFIFESPQFKTGYMAYEGRVEFNSLIDYFINNMAKDGWKTQSALRSGNSALVFDKPGKSALIRVMDGSFKTRVIIIAVESKSAAPLPTVFDSETVILDSDSEVIEDETGIIE